MSRLSTSGVERDEAADVMPAARFSSANRGLRSRAARTAAMILALAMAATLGYALLAPLAAPWLGRLAFDKLATNASEWPTQAERIRFAPFALALELEQAQIAAGDGDVVAVARTVRADFSYESLLTLRPVLDELEVRGAEVRDAPRAASALWSLFATSAVDAQIAVLGAEAVLPGVENETPTKPTLTVRGTDVELGTGRGTLAVEARDALGSGSSLSAELTAASGDDGAELRGAMTLARGQLTFGHWTFAAPSAALSLEAQLSPRSITAAFALLSGGVAASDIDAPTVRLELTDGTAAASWEPNAGLRAANVRGSLAGGGRVELAVARAPSAPWQLQTQLAALPATTLAPYFSAAVGAEPAGGTITLELSLGPRDTAAIGLAKVTGSSIRVAADAPAAATAIALLEPPDSAITLEVALAPGRRAVEQVVAEIASRVAAIAAAPLEALAALVDRSAAELAVIEFAPGTAELAPGSEQELDDLARALRLRPRVGLRFDANEGGFVDRAALAHAQVALHVTLATSRAEPAGRNAAVDFASPRAQDVLDEFARERLDAATRENIASAFPRGEGQPAMGASRADYYRAIFAALAEREPIAESALRRLAEFRARALANRLGELGVASARVAADGAPPAPGDVLVLLPLTLAPAPFGAGPLP
jgi:hypothetical protein